MGTNFLSATIGARFFEEPNFPDRPLRLVGHKHVAIDIGGDAGAAPGHQVVSAPIPLPSPNYQAFCRLGGSLGGAAKLVEGHEGVEVALNLVARRGCTFRARRPRYETTAISRLTMGQGAPVEPSPMWSTCGPPLVHRNTLVHTTNVTGVDPEVSVSSLVCDLIVKIRV
jgi:hypothetical protein